MIIPKGPDIEIPVILLSIKETHMEKRKALPNSSLIDKEVFIAGTDRLSPSMHGMQKLERGIIIFCRQGWAQFTIDLKQYEITEGIQIVLLPKSILRVDGTSDDFLISFLEFSGEMFQEACIHLEPTFFHFIKENPCYQLPEENKKAINGLMEASEAIYLDKENRFQLQIIKNHLQCFLLEVYDKCHRLFTRQQLEGKNRQDETFKRFVALIHEHCSTERDVTFYADRLCISCKYLTGISKSITGESAKKIIDELAVLEIKVLLQAGKFTLQEISDRLQFPDQSYMGRYFKRHEGMSPKEYLNKHVS